MDDHNKMKCLLHFNLVIHRFDTTKSSNTRGTTSDKVFSTEKINVKFTTNSIRDPFSILFFLDVQAIKSILKSHEKRS